MSSKMPQGKLIVFSAPSGSGKTTIVRHLLAQKELNLEFSVSAVKKEGLKSMQKTIIFCRVMRLNNT